LQPVPQPNNFFGNDIFYDLDGGASLPRADPAAYTYFGNPQAPGGHPGRGSSQAADGLEHYAIAAFTLPTAGSYSLANAVLRSSDNSFDGIHVRVFVNDTDTGIDAHAGALSSANFDANLGNLNAGDTIYVAVGSGQTDFADSFRLEFQVFNSPVVPEPASLSLLGIGIGIASVAVLGWRSRHCQQRPTA
jgi:hypothetical protein